MEFTKRAKDSETAYKMSYAVWLAPKYQSKGAYNISYLYYIKNKMEGNPLNTYRGV